MPGTPARTADAATAAEVVCLGESMVTFLPSQPGRLADVPSFGRGIGGAESNVACALAAAGHRAAWVSRAGADGFGDHLVEAIAGYGVDTSGVRRDPSRPTGIYFRTATDRATDVHEVAYYRAGSAASAMSPANIPYATLPETRVLHLSGITAALSADCLALLHDLTEPRPGRPLISFDVNHRPGLWRDADASPEVLLDLARRSDLVFVGEDEAEEAWGVSGAEAIRAALPEPATLVVKRGADGATVFSRAAGIADADDVTTVPDGIPDADIVTTVPDGFPDADIVTTVPALRVDVVAPVGAGDAFAAGFLSATLRELPVRDRVRHGHLMAAAVLTVPGDLTAPPARAHADSLAALDDEAWGRLRLGPGWTGDDQEVRTT
ncbi:sugar kinase [Streptomyces sp. NBC_00893]|uniref:sugar kinase n=1 Tax=Streptomyces sp. NBC_00893 TaxID=2975862 RepID=UPI00225586DB|nr:sugar kinase [Streptomyces sp. NBC_00893]MCX4845622.1 sugar kinase [Streptomyces sp. NBC_00893]